MICFSSPLLPRLDSDDDQEPRLRSDSAPPVEGRSHNNESTNTEEPVPPQLGQAECKESNGAARLICSFLKGSFIHNSSVLSSQWQTAESGMYRRALSCFWPK